MLFRDIYKNRKRPIISFEIFPPRTPNGMAKLRSVILPDLIQLQPDFISVTYGAMGTTRDKTIDIASFIKNDLSQETACHLTCVASSRKDIDSILDKLRQSNIENIIALRGDPPEGKTDFESYKNGYKHANELVDHIRQYEHLNNVKFGIAVAGYPEKHIEARSMDEDLNNLKNKVVSGADVVITQLFFDNNYFYSFLDKLQEIDIKVPIVPGLMPIISTKQINKITSMCGSTIPQKLSLELKDAEEDDKKATSIGIDQCIRQANDLLSKGVPGIHFYVLNHSDHIKEIMKQLDI